uniref:Uncharacterized protein n=1 Tax=Cucumis melo TaxID=3656 RepID=A0A9I9E672_CUCME
MNRIDAAKEGISASHSDATFGLNYWLFDCDCKEHILTLNIVYKAGIYHSQSTCAIVDGIIKSSGGVSLRVTLSGQNTS